jgi:hypothetical protein
MQISAMLRARARAEVGRGGFYLADHGESWLTNASSGPIPGDFWTGAVGADLVLPVPRPRAPYIFAGIDIRVYSKGRHDLPPPPGEDWKPYMTMPRQQDFGLNIGAGAPWPVPVEAVARLGSPLRRFIAEEKRGPIWEFSLSVHGPFLNNIRRGR